MYTIMRRIYFNFLYVRATTFSSIAEVHPSFFFPLILLLLPKPYEDPVQDEELYLPMYLHKWRTSKQLGMFVYTDEKHRNITRLF